MTQYDPNTETVEVRTVEPGYTETVETVVVRESELIPVAWGDISGCRLETSPRGMLLRVAFSAAVIAYLWRLMTWKPRVTAE